MNQELSESPFHLSISDSLKMNDLFLVLCLNPRIFTRIFAGCPSLQFLKPNACVHRVRGVRQPLPKRVFECSVASSLDSLEVRIEVCVLCLPPGFPAVPQYIILAQLSVRTLSEPDVRC
jgi:hypothetical protein